MERFKERYSEKLSFSSFPVYFIFSIIIISISNEDIYWLIWFSEENAESYDLKEKLFESDQMIFLLFNKIQNLLGLKFSQSSYKEFASNPKSFETSEPFDETDLVLIGIYLIILFIINKLDTIILFIILNRRKN